MILLVVIGTTDNLDCIINKYCYTTAIFLGQIPGYVMLVWTASLSFRTLKALLNESAPDIYIESSDKE
jgi:hypothetical protein